MINRIVIDESRLTNNSLCGTDTEFCVPITRPYDNVFFIRPTNDEDFNLSNVTVYDKDGNILVVLVEATLYQFFNYVKAKDSNGNLYFLLQQKAPIYNYAGVTPEVTCYSVKVDLLSDPSGILTEYYSEQLCYIDTYTMKHYTIAGAVADTNIAQFEVECDNDGNPQIYDFSTLPIGWFLEYGTGPFIDLYIPTNCVLIAAVIGAANLPFVFVEQTFGTNACSTYVTLQGNGIFNYDCKGRYYTDHFEEPIGTEYSFNTNQLPHYIDDYNIHIQGAMQKQLANVSTPKKISSSCYIPSNEVLNRFKVSGNCPVPAWYVEEVNIIAATQTVYLTGTSPVADDNNVLIGLVQGDNYSWKERKQSEMFCPILFFDSCVCFVNFIC